MANTDGNKLQTSAKSLQILDCLQSGERRLNDLAEALDMNKSTVHNHLATLVDAGYAQKQDGRYRIDRSQFTLVNPALALSLLAELQEQDGCTVSELAALTPFNEQTIEDWLEDLRSDGYVVADGEGYQIGLRFLDMGGYRRNQMDLYRAAAPKVDQLSEETGELANLLTEETGMGVYLHQTRGEQGLSLDTYTGFRCHLHTTALGKAILAHLPENRVAEIATTHGLPAMNQNTITDLDTLKEELETIRERGYAIDNQERLEGLRCIAVPVTTDTGEVLGSVSIAAPTSRMKGKRFEEEIPELVQEAVNLIELEINYS